MNAEPVSACLAYERAETAAHVRSLAAASGVLIESEIDLAAMPLETSDAPLLLLEQGDSLEALTPRVYSVTAANPDVLVVLLVPGAYAAVEAELFAAGAFDVLELDATLPARLTRTVALARRVVALQNERSRLNSDLAQQEKLTALGLLAAGVSHEINNPCAAILGNMGALRDQLESVLARPRFQRVTALEERAPDWLEAMGDCIGAAKRIHAIVRTLNVFSRREENAPAAPVDVNEEISTVLRLIGKEVRFQSNFEVLLDPELPRILAPLNAVTQILTNLVVNALQALEVCPAGDRWIWISTRHDEAHVMVEVADNGPGIAAENVGRIFDPFFTTKSVGEGTGLGLAITRQLVQRAGGEIFVETAPDEGARFSVVFPQAPAEAAAPRARVSQPPRHDRLRVLVVDDDELMLRSMQRSLAPHFELIARGRGSDALASLRTDDQIDVVLSDIVMPDMNGIEFYQHLLREHPRLAGRTVFMSAGITSEALRSRLSETGRPFLAKPLDPQELVRTIRYMGVSADGVVPA